jgi:hypothetical protein
MAPAGGEPGGRGRPTDRAGIVRIALRRKVLRGRPLLLPLVGRDVHHDWREQGARDQELRRNRSASLSYMEPHALQRTKADVRSARWWCRPRWRARDRLRGREVPGARPKLEVSRGAPGKPVQRDIIASDDAAVPPDQTKVVVGFSEHLDERLAEDKSPTPRLLKEHDGRRVLSCLTFRQLPS